MLPAAHGIMEDLGISLWQDRVQEFPKRDYRDSLSQQLRKVLEISSDQKLSLTRHGNFDKHLVFRVRKRKIERLREYGDPGTFEEPEQFLNEGLVE